MKFIDRAFATTVAVFALGSVAGALAVSSLPPLRVMIGTLLVVRLLKPVQEASLFGSSVLVMLIFANNSTTVLLSFVYPLILGKVRWTPTPSQKTMKLLLGGFSALAGFLIGFLNLGAILAWAWENGGWLMLQHLLAVSWLHGPVEFLFILLAVAEPLRLRGIANRGIGLVDAVKEDWKLICICLIGLLASAIVQVLARA